MTTHFTATSPTDFDNDIADINAGPDSAADTPYTIALSTGITIGSLTLTLPQGSSLEIDGPGFLVDTAGSTLTVTGALTLDAPFTGDVLLDGSTLTIDAVTNTGIQGGGAFTGAISGETASDAVINHGTIATTEMVGVHLTGGTVTDTAGASISGGNFGVAFDDVGMLTNAGTVMGGEVGASFATDGTVTNAAAGVIEGGDNGVVVTGVATLTNDGTIEATGSDAIFAGSGTVINGSAVATSALIQTAKYDAVEIDGAGMVTNDGRIVSTDSTGVYLGSGEVDNGLDATGAVIQGAEFGVLVTTASGTVRNDGTIMLAGTPGQAGSEIAVVLEDGGTVVNGPASASITAAAKIAGVDYGISILGAAGTVDNTGSITGSLGVDLEAGGNRGQRPGAGRRHDHGHFVRRAGDRPVRHGGQCHQRWQHHRAGRRRLLRRGRFHHRHAGG